MGQQSAVEKQTCEDCPIRHRAVCSYCGADELAQLEQLKFYKTYAPGQSIVLAGDETDFVASVVSGIATLTETMEDGRRQMVGLLLPSDFIGRPGRQTLQYDVTAVTDVTLCNFHRKPFETLLLEIPHIQERMLEMALDELDAAREWMLLLGRKTAREKIASFLMTIAKRTLDPRGQVDGGQCIIELPISRETMGNFLGLTIETVSRVISDMKRKGVIRLEKHDKVIINRICSLCQLTGAHAD